MSERVMGELQRMGFSPKQTEKGHFIHVSIC